MLISEQLPWTPLALHLYALFISGGKPFLAESLKLLLSEV